MPWDARLDLDYRLESGRSVARFVHSGPLRILQSLYPEGDAVCHNVLVHPPGGLVGGDTLDIDVRAASGTHGLITTPGASRFYRSAGEPAVQRTHLQLAPGARMEWLPLEALCYSGCLAQNRLRIECAPGAELLGWDVTALGLPLSGQPFDRGSLLQEIEVPGAWLERGRISADNTRVMDGPLGLAGHRCLATLFFVAGEPLARPRRERALELARTLIGDSPLDATSGATSPNPQVVVVRVLAPVVEPAMALLRGVWAAWRENFWSKSASSPRGCSS